MKKNFLSLMFLVGVIVLLLSSCSKVPKYAKLIPEDATILVRADIKQMAEKSGVDDNDKLKKKLKEELKNADLGKSARKKIEEIIDNPAETGLDLRDPVIFFSKMDKNDERNALVGSVYDDDDLTALLNLIGKEAGEGKVKEKQDINYFIIDSFVIVYDNNSFYATAKEYGQDAEDLVDDVIQLFNGDGKDSMADEKVMKELVSHNGIMQLLINGEGLENLREMREIKRIMPDDLELKDVAMVYDLVTNKGETLLKSEIIALSSEWEKQIKKADDICSTISGEFAKNISKDGFACFLSVDGKKYFEWLNDMELFKNTDKAELKLTKKIIECINGDMAINIPQFDLQQSIPTFAVYAKTEDNELLKFITTQLGQDANKKSDNEYVVSLGGQYDYQTGSIRGGKKVMVGYKKNITFAEMEGVVMKNTFSSSDLKGKRFYAYLNAKSLKNFSDMFSGDERALFNRVINSIDYADAYYESNGKATFRLISNDKKKTILEEIATLVSDYIEGNIKNDGVNDEASDSSSSADESIGLIADTTAVESDADLYLDAPQDDF